MTNPHRPSLDGVIDSREAAHILGRTTNTISVYVREGLLTPVYQGRGIRGGFLFHRADIEALANTVRRIA